jgi:hypothetical protein
MSNTLVFKQAYSGTAGTYNVVDPWEGYFAQKAAQ